MTWLSDKISNLWSRILYTLSSRQGVLYVSLLCEICLGRESRRGVESLSMSIESLIPNCTSYIFDLDCMSLSHSQVTDWAILKYLEWSFSVPNQKTSNRSVKHQQRSDCDCMSFLLSQKTIFPISDEF